MTGIIAIIIGTMLFVYTILLIKGFHSTWRSQVFLGLGDLEQALIELGQAIRYDPLRAENYYNLSLLFDDQARSSGDRTEILQLLYLAQRAHELESYNPAYIYRYGELLLNYVDQQEGLEKIDMVVELRPLMANSYLQAGRIRLQLAEFYIANGDYAEAEIYLSALDVLEQKMLISLGDSKALALIMGRAMFLKGDYERSRSYFLEVPEDDPQHQIALEHLDAIEDLQSQQ